MSLYFGVLKEPALLDKLNASADYCAYHFKKQLRHKRLKLEAEKKAEFVTKENATLPSFHETDCKCSIRDVKLHQSSVLPFDLVHSFVKIYANAQSNQLLRGYLCYLLDSALAFAIKHLGHATRVDFLPSRIECMNRVAHLRAGKQVNT